MKIVIRAGGVGTRLWPVSRKHYPKQFHALTSKRTMLQEAIDRVRPLAEYADLFVSTSAESADLVRQQAKEIPADNIIVEPARKDTAAAIGLESIIIHKQDPEAIVASLGSDHSVRRVGEFQRMLRVAEECVRRHPEYIIPIGIKPQRPDSGYGYIQYGEVIDTLEAKNVWRVTQFTEKPTLEKAQEFLEQGNFLWNANMFVWRVDTILDLYKKHLPLMYEQLQMISAALGTPRQQAVIDEVYPQMEQIAVDYGIIEKAENIAAISADIGWNDIGDWTRLKDEIAESAAANVVIGDAEHLSLDTTDTLVYGAQEGKLIVTIGLEDMIVVDTPDALLVAHKKDSARVKDVVQKLEDEHKDMLL